MILNPKLFNKTEKNSRLSETKSTNIRYGVLIISPSQNYPLSATIFTGQSQGGFTGVPILWVTVFSENSLEGIREAATNEFTSQIAAEIGPAEPDRPIRLLMLFGDLGHTEKELLKSRLRAQAKHGNADAEWQLFRFGNRYGYRYGAEAWYWLCLAAHHGQVQAQAQIAYHLWHCIIPTDEDRVRALLWYRLAAAGGHPGIQRNIALIEDKLTPDQRLEVERLYREGNRLTVPLLRGRS